MVREHLVQLRNFRRQLFRMHQQNFTLGISAIRSNCKNWCDAGKQGEFTWEQPSLEEADLFRRQTGNQDSWHVECVAWFYLFIYLFDCLRETVSVKNLNSEEKPMLSFLKQLAQLEEKWIILKWDEYRCVQLGLPDMKILHDLNGETNEVGQHVH